MSETAEFESLFRAQQAHALRLRESTAEERIARLERLRDGQSVSRQDS